MRLFIGNKHRRWQQDLSAYLDGQLEPHKREALESHLIQCASCQEELEALRGVVALLHRVPQVPVPRSFTLSQAPARRVWLSAGYAAPLRYATAAAALLLLAVAIGDLVTGQPSVTAPEALPSAEYQEDSAVDEAARTTAAPVPKGQDAFEATQAPESMAATAPEEAQEAPAKAAPPAPMPEGPGTTDTLLRVGRGGTGCAPGGASRPGGHPVVAGPTRTGRALRAVELFGSAVRLE